MSALSDLQDSVTALAAKVDAHVANDGATKAENDALKAQVTDLQGQLAAQDPALVDLKASVDASAAKLG